MFPQAALNPGYLPTTNKVPSASPQRTAARRASFMRVVSAAMPNDIGKFKQIKVTIQRSIIGNH